MRMTCAIAFDGRMDCIKRHLIVDRHGEQFGRAGLDRTDGHQNVAVPDDERDRESDTYFRLRIAIEWPIKASIKPAEAPRS